MKTCFLEPSHSEQFVQLEAALPPSVISLRGDEGSSVTQLESGARRMIQLVRLQMDAGVNTDSRSRNTKGGAR